MENIVVDEYSNQHIKANIWTRDSVICKIMIRISSKHPNLRFQGQDIYILPKYN